MTVTEARPVAAPVAAPTAPPATAASPTRAMESWSKGLDLRALAGRFGTPLYLHHPATLRRNFAAYLPLVGAPGNVRYPVKANPTLLVLRELAALGSGADCASIHEVRLALGAGIGLERLSYNTPAFDPALAERLLLAGADVVADSAAALEEISGRLAGERFDGRLLVRVNPGGLPGYRRVTDVQRYTSHGSATSQFGIPSEEVPALLARCLVPVGGLHVHVGTQMDNLETFAEGLAFLHALVDLVEGETPHRLGVLNLGGGLGIPFQDGQEFPSVEALVERLRPRLRADRTYQVEPGNSLVGDAVALLARVAAVKETRGRRWAIADVGTDQLVKHTVARWEHQIVRPDHRPLPAEGPDALAGPLCFAGDVLLPATRLGDLQAGDPLLVRHAGAYCEAVSSRFNGRPAPGHVTIGEGGEARRVRRAEDFFFEPALQTHLPLSAPEGEEAGRPVDPARVAALESAYMHRLAEGDRFDLGAVRALGGGRYRFEVATAAEVGFVAMPLALRIVGDAAIVAVGLELGWSEKPGPVWATRLSMSCGAVLPAGEPLPCEIEVGHLAPGLEPGRGAVGTVHYRLGPAGEVSGVARVVVPEPETV